MLTPKQIVILQDPHRIADHLIIYTQPWCSDLANCTTQQIDILEVIVKLKKAEQQNYFIHNNKLYNTEYKQHKHYRKRLTGALKGKFVTGYTRHYD